MDGPKPEIPLTLTQILSQLAPICEQYENYNYRADYSPIIAKLSLNNHSISISKLYRNALFNAQCNVKSYIVMTKLQKCF